MRGVGKLLLTLAVAALLAVGLAACGGGDSSPSSTTTTPGDDAATQSENGGGGAEGSASFRTNGGDNSIQNYGEEAEAAEVEAAEGTLSEYLEARAENDWEGQCTSLAAAAIKPLERLAPSSAQLKGKGCAGILKALTAGIPAAARANTLIGGVASLRVEGERGFALYHGPKGVDYFVPMVKEDGEWKVGALEPTEFP